MLNSLIRIGILIPWAVCSFGQRPYELNVTSANDNYYSRFQDGYFTNGVWVSYTYVPSFKRTILPKRVTKELVTYQLGQLIFTPEFIKYQDPDRMDRPYAGYLFLRKERRYFFQKGAILAASLSVGTTGRASLADRTQLTVHRLLHLTLPKGWKYQVKNALGVNLQLRYWHEMLAVGPTRKWLKVYGTAQGTVGFPFTNASAGVLCQVGLFNKADESALFQARLRSRGKPSRKQPEVYLFAQPVYEHQFYNATVQGRFYASNDGSIVRPLQPNVFTWDAGITFSPEKWTFQLVYTFRQKEAATMLRAERYLSLAMAHRFDSKR